jgi:membrane-associated phospholipid phosphatase
MSIAAADLDRRRRIAAWAFVALLALSVFWPSPVVTINQLCCHEPLPVDDLSFLGREAPSFDVVFWCVAGLFAIAIAHSGSMDVQPLHDYRSLRVRWPRHFALAVIATLVAVALIWRLADARVTAWAEALQSERTEDFVRIANRFGGGMNPALIVLFFLLAGLAYRHRAWVDYAVAMALAGAGAGLAVQIIKFATGRARPELWLGPFVHARSSASSFPSGHTVGAFALGGVLVFASRSLPLRVAALVLAIAVGLSRIFAFRHWASDVFASAAAGLLAAWIASEAVIRLTTDRRARP